MKLLCIGDIALVNENLGNWEWEPPGGFMPGDDERILFNWEIPIGDSINPTPRSRGRRLLAHPDSLSVNRRWQPGFATLATNHILDAGEEGLGNTIEVLNQSGFMTVGAGRTWEEITKPLFWETTEGRLAVINWVFPETHPDWMSVPGPNCWPGIEDAKCIIHELKHEADWVLIVVHWSDEYFSYPRPEDRTIAREFAKMGADLVIGHHPHVVRGMEIIESCPVFFSIGNFYFSDVSDTNGSWIIKQAPRNREGLGIQITFQRGKRPKYCILSFWNAKKEVVLDPLGRAARRMERVSHPLRQYQNSEYNKWYGVKRTKFNKLGYRLHFSIWQKGIRGLIQYALRFVRSQPHINL